MFVGEVKYDIAMKSERVASSRSANDLYTRMIGLGFRSTTTTMWNSRCF